MEPLLLITGATALNIALVALMDVLGRKVPRRRKLAWSAVILGLPLIGAILYYMRAEGQPGRPKRASRRALAPSPRRPVDEDLPVPTSEPRG